MRKKSNVKAQATKSTKGKKVKKTATSSEDSDYDLSQSSQQHVPKSKKPIRKINMKAQSKAQVKASTKPQAKIQQKNEETSLKSQQQKGYTSTEYAKYKQWYNKLMDYKNAELKQMLKKNMQSMSGNKIEMIGKIADGIVLGRIPRCPNCFGGRPKYNYIEGTYFCRGYHDDQEMKECNSTFTRQEIKRQTWQM